MKKVNYRDIPLYPGVYIFRDKSNKIIYIGKALNLKRRLLSYFTKPEPAAFTGKGASNRKIQDTDLCRSERIYTDKKKITGIARIEWKITGSEIEALVLESQLIKKYKPKFNILMRDDKNYFFAAVTKEQFPKIYITHQREGNCQYIGPFTDGSALKSTLKYLRTVFPYCTCRKTHKGKCLNAHLGRCLDYCCNKNVIANHPREYKKNINSIIKILKGQRKSLVKNLRAEMKKKAQKQDFEQAAELRDKIENLEKIFAHKRVIRPEKISTHSYNLSKELKNLLSTSNSIRRIEAYDIANIQGKSATASMVVFSNGVPDKKEYRRFKIRLTERPDDITMVREVINRRLKHVKCGLSKSLHKDYWAKPDLILVDGGRPQLNVALEEIIKNKLNIPVIALAKKDEKIYIYRKKPIRLPVNSPLLNLFRYLRDEAHRFARKYHHLLRDKEILSLDKIKKE